MARFGGRVPVGYVTVWPGKSVLVRLDAVSSGEAWRFWLGAARSGIAWLGPAGFGTAVVATCDKTRLGWQGWAVMEGRGLIGVRKSRRSGYGPSGSGRFRCGKLRKVRRSRLGSVCSGASGYGKSCFGGAAQGGSGRVRLVKFCLGWAW